MYNETRNKATQKYHKEHLEQVAIRVPKGKREEYKQISTEYGLSLAGMITTMFDTVPYNLYFMLGENKLQELTRITQQNGTNIHDLISAAVTKYIDKYQA